MFVTAGVPGMLLGTAVVAAGTEEVPGVPAGVVAITAEQSLGCEAAARCSNWSLVNQLVWRK